MTIVLISGQYISNLDLEKYFRTTICKSVKGWNISSSGR